MEAQLRNKIFENKNLKETLHLDKSRNDIDELLRPKNILVSYLNFTDAL